jgi:hypothetical protein
MVLDPGKTVTTPTRNCPNIDLAYAVTHRDARKSRSRFAQWLFKADDSGHTAAEF